MQAVHNRLHGSLFPGLRINMASHAKPLACGEGDDVADAHLELASATGVPCASFLGQPFT